MTTKLRGDEPKEKPFKKENDDDGGTENDDQSTESEIAEKGPRGEKKKTEEAINMDVGIIIVITIIRIIIIRRSGGSGGQTSR